jgi:hypothetical protein
MPIAPIIDGEARAARFVPETARLVLGGTDN